MYRAALHTVRYLKVGTPLHTGTLQAGLDPPDSRRMYSNGCTSRSPSPLLRHHSTALLHPLHYYSARVILSELAGNLYGDSRSWAGLGWAGKFTCPRLSQASIFASIFSAADMCDSLPRCQMSSGESSRKELCNSMSSSGGSRRKPLLARVSGYHRQLRGRASSTVQNPLPIARPIE